MSSKPKVFIIAGHNEFTYENEGAKGGVYPDGVFEEFNFNIAVVTAIVNLLKPYSKELEIIQLEYDNNKVDYTLGQRIKKINSIGKTSDLIISNHANAGLSSMKGQWGFYASSRGLDFLNMYAANCKNSLIKYTKHFKCKFDDWTEFGIVLRTIPVAVLIEYGFFTNVDDRKLLRSPIFINNSAERVVESILQYYNIKKIETIKTWQNIIKEKTDFPKEWIDEIEKLQTISNNYDLGEFGNVLKNLGVLIQKIYN